jgi:hypothetical protein
MRGATDRWGFCARIIIGLAVIAALTPSARGYINGGDYHNSLIKYEKKLKADGWGVCVSAPVSADSHFGARGMAFVPPDNPEHERYVNQLVGKALQSLPEKERGKISAEAKREIASLTREAIQQALTDKRQVITKGQTGSLQYEVGASAYEAYWETNYGRRPEIHARRSGLAPFVALKVVAPKDPPEQQP